MYNLCCISNDLKEKGISFRTMTFKRFLQLCEQSGDEKALFELGSRWLNNVEVTIESIKHCSRNNWGYRVSSSIFPCLTHPEFKYDISDVPQYKEIMQIFAVNRPALIWTPKRDEEREMHEDEDISLRVRLSTHPDQFNVLASNNQNAVNKTINELNYQGWLMDQLGCQRNHFNPINIHVNCTDGSLEEIAQRFMSNLKRCHISVKKRIVLENEDKGCWNVQNLIDYFYKPYRIPITFDNLHHMCNPSPLLNNDKLAMEECAKTWNCRPIFHYSESNPYKTNPRSHAEMPRSFPQNNQYDWDIELKSKDKAIRAVASMAINHDMKKLKLKSDAARWKTLLSDQGIQNNGWNI
tara:strand:+ start:1463 stop:2518 length:1056 start_codon:yes stop_codon:yes gene_type:complete